MLDHVYGVDRRAARRRQAWKDMPNWSPHDRDQFLKRHADFDVAAAGSREMYEVQEGEIYDYGDRPGVLPFGRDFAKWSPWDTSNAPFGQAWLGNMVALICKRLDETRTRPTRLIFCSGSVPRTVDRIGTAFTARHDQTGARLGRYKVVGIAVYDPDGYLGRVVGDVPDVKFACSTYK